MKTRLSIAALLTALNGCASSYTQPTLPADHPASSAAPAAPPGQRSHTLDIAASEPASAAPAEKPTDQAGRDTVDPTMPAAPTAPAPESAALYACPMHPEQTSEKPGQRCPRCNMQLKPVGKPGEAR